MRKVVGTLCYISLLVAIGCSIYCVYGIMSIFGRGGGFYTYGDWGPDYELVEQLARNGINNEDNDILKGYVTSAEPPGTTEFQIGILYLLLDNIRPVTRLYSNINWAMVADLNGRVVAAYPANMGVGIGKVYDSTNRGWRVAFPAGKDVPSFTVIPIDDPNDKTLGSIAISYRPYDMVAITPNADGQHILMYLHYTLLTAIICLLAFLILLPTWVAMDASWRGMNPFAWAALVIITGLIGLAAYFSARLSQPKPCPNCGERINKKYIRCPSCGIDLSSKCSICGSAINPGWQFCPKCNGVPPAKPEPVSVPGYKPEHIALTKAALTVTVLDNNGMPVPDCSVKISGMSESTGMTNNKGIFQAYALEDGVYTVSLSKDGYTDLQKEANVSTISPAAIQLIMTAHSGTIAGCVMSAENGNLVASARVSLDSARLDFATHTDDSGHYILEDIPAGPQAVCASADQYLNRIQVAQVVPDQKVELDFALDSIAEPVELESSNVTK